MRMTEVAESRASMVNPNMDRLKDFILSKPSGKWTLPNPKQSKG